MVILHVREGVLRPGVNPDRVFMLGVMLMGITSMGFYSIEGMIADDAGGSREVNAFYCAAVTLTTVGYGDICPTDKIGMEGRLFLIATSFIGLGLFCGPLLNLTAAWRHSVPGGIYALASFTLAMGVVLFSSFEGLDTTDALYAAVITGTTIGYGDITPHTDHGKVLVALYAILVVNVMGALLESTKNVMIQVCMNKKNTTKSTETNSKLRATAPTEDEAKELVAAGTKKEL